MPDWFYPPSHEPSRQNGVPKIGTQGDGGIKKPIDILGITVKEAVIDIAGTADASKSSDWS